MENNNVKDYKKLYIGNLGYEITKDHISNLINKKGYNFKECFLVKNKEGKSKGFCLVKFFFEDIAKRVFDELKNEKIKGRSLKIFYGNKNE